ncbi:hemolysin XhlA family protein [Nocardia sp. alder85J]|uniref:hemolysin XhlA family protein n=1 Tax=Nocardia sp. alder85J TaxID=2862949 RepID=UPI001CD63CBA|nr:hemolysin XhlA family protein [Nocardia sp. alder85J]MCX4091664.1 hemolysin XhlA family protein [Nocardia sp. alder85J]
MSATVPEPETRIPEPAAEPAGHVAATTALASTTAEPATRGSETGSVGAGSSAGASVRVPGAAEATLDTLVAATASIGARVDGLAERLDRHGRRFHEIEARPAGSGAHSAERFQHLMTAINILGAQTRERLDRQELRLERIEQKVQETDARSRSVEENLAEIRDMLLRALERG